MPARPSAGPRAGEYNLDMEPNPYESPRCNSEPPEREKRLGVDAFFLFELAVLVFFLFVVPFFILPLFHQTR